MTPPIELKGLCLAIRDLPDNAMVTIKYHDRAYKIETYNSFLGIFYRLFFSFLPQVSIQQELNSQTHTYLRQSFPPSALDRVFPSTYHRGLPITVREIRSLLFSTGMPLLSDLKGMNFEKINCLSLEDFQEGVPSFSSDHGLTLEGQKQVVLINKMSLRPKIIEQLANRAAGGADLNPDFFWINSLKRCFGVNTSVGQLLETPEGLYHCVQKQTHCDCKYLIFEPLDNNSLPSRIIFLQTQTTLTSFHANLHPEIGVRGVLEVEGMLEGYLRSGKKCIFMGYSLGGIQAFLSLLLFPKSVTELFCVANPGTTKEICKYAENHLMRLRENERLQMKFYHDSKDLIPMFGEEQPYYRIRGVDLTLKVIKPINEKERSTEGAVFRGVPANIFDVLEALLKSFCIYHPRLCLDPSKVRLIDLDRAAGNRAPLGLVKLLKMCADYFGREGKFLRRLNEKHGGIDPLPYSPTPDFRTPYILPK